jgi:hypothetical protein
MIFNVVSCAKLILMLQKWSSRILGFLSEKKKYLVGCMEHFAEQDSHLPSDESVTISTNIWSKLTNLKIVSKNRVPC